MKYISGNLNFSSYENIKNALSEGTGDAIEKKLPHIMTGDNENSDYLGECIFKLHYDISDAGTYTLFLNNILPEKVFLNGEEVDPNTNTANLLEGEYTVEIYSKRYWEEINEILFNNLPGLKKIEFPRPLKRFGLGSIQNCSNLETLVFGKNVEDLIHPISGGYFLNCPVLNKIEINKRNKNIIIKDEKYIFSKEGEFLLSTDGSLPTTGIKVLRKGWTGKTTFNNLVIANSIETLEEGVFEGCTFTGSLTLGEGLETIKEKAFYNIDITGLDTLIIKSQDPPIIESPQYFDLRDIDDQGNSISGINFEVIVSKSGLSAQYNNNWSNYISFFDPNDFEFQYLAFEVIEDSTFTFSFNTSADVDSLSYSLDNGNTWTTVLPKTWQSPYTITTPTVLAGNTITWKGIAKKYGYHNPGPGFSYSRFSSTGRYNISGNILSLFYDDYFIGLDSFPIIKNWNGYNIASTAGIFSGIYNGSSIVSSKVVDAHNLILPKTVTSGAYAHMFGYCTLLTRTPNLPATTLAERCYYNMFYGCTSLTTLPSLPATTLAGQCYGSMFEGCTNLTSVAENYLPATTLAYLCYAFMFKGCTSLVTAPKLPATTLNEGCYEYMFYGCTSLESAPELPANTLAPYCYSNMFKGCSHLDYIKALFTTAPSTQYTDSWVDGVAGYGTFIKNPNATWSSTGIHYVPSGWDVEYYLPENYNWFTTTAIDNSAFTLTIPQQIDTTDLKYIEYSIDNGTTWTKIQNSGSQAVIITTPTVSAGNSVRWRGMGTRLARFDSGTFSKSQFSSSGRYNISGILNSLISCSEDLSRSAGYTFYSLFRDSSNLISSENLSLPSTTLTNYCYGNMFENCSSLTTAPTLPATTLAQWCYCQMFEGCTSLTEAPDLPATKVNYQCYPAMFKNCISLTTAPNLPASTLVEGCYRDMFSGCTSLTEAPTLSATTLANGCYSNMFYRCTALTTAPNLPATTLVQSCYYNMFYGCTNLNYIKAMFTTTPSDTYTQGWVQGVAATGTFVKNSAAQWNVTGNNGIPSGWTVETASS